MPENRSTRVQECAHIYPNGRTCRRLPKRGEKLCLGHQTHRRRRPGEEDELFEKQMNGWVEQLDALPLEQMLAVLQASLAGISELIDRKSSRAHRLAFARAGASVGVAHNKLDEMLTGYRTHAITRAVPQRATQSAPPPALDFEFAPGATAEDKLPAIDRIEALCGKLLSTLPPDDDPQPLCDETDASHRRRMASPGVRN